MKAIALKVLPTSRTTRSGMGAASTGTGSAALTGLPKASDRNASIKPKVRFINSSGIVRDVDSVSRLRASYRQAAVQVHLTLRGRFTIGQFIVVAPRRSRRCDQGFARRIRCGRRWLASILVLAVAACDTVASLSGRPIPDESAPPPRISANAVQLAPTNPGRAVARMPTDSPGEPPAPAIVVRGRETATPARIVLPDPNGKSGDVTLNFAGADIRDVVAAILGDALKVNYVVDPEVMGPVTININRPVPRDELLSTLEAVLNSRGATMVQSDGIIRVMPMRKDGKPTSAAPMLSGVAPTIGEHNGVFPLRYVSATDMQHVLEKVLPPGQTISADDQRHVLIVQGSPTDLKVAEDTVRIFDIDQLRGMSMALVPLSHAEPASDLTISGTCSSCRVRRQI